VPLTPPRVVDAWLEPFDTSADVSRIPIAPGDLTIGRTPPSTVLIQHAAIGGMHARIRRTPDLVVIEDLSSTNGTYINGRRINEAAELCDGDAVALSGACHYRVRIVYAPTELLEDDDDDMAFLERGCASLIRDWLSTVPNQTPEPSLELSGEKGTFSLARGTHIIGRAGAATLIVQDRQISKAHASIRVGDAETRVQDLGSANGTFVNGTRVPPEGAPLRNGDRLALGAVEFVVQLRP
jgi:pSer/pThr/pTyr-binding forkhead associated (FHA) protein